MTSRASETDQPSEELVLLAHISLRSGIPLPDLIELDPIYIAAYLAALDQEHTAAKRK